MNPKIYLLVLCMLLILPVVTAVEPSFIFKQCEDVNIKIRCFNNVSYCAPDDMCTLSVDYPNGTILLDNATMTNQNTFHNKTIFAPKTCTTGTYSAITLCTGNTSQYSTWYFGINPTGNQEDSVLNNPTLIILAGLSFIILIFGLVTKNAYLGFIAGVSFILTGVYVMVYGFAGLTDLYSRGVASIFIGLGLLFSIVSAYEGALKDD